MRSSTRGLPDEYSQHPQGGTQYFSWKPKCAGRLLAKPGVSARRRQASPRIRTEARCRSASSGSTAGCALSRVDSVRTAELFGRSQPLFSLSVVAAVSAAESTKARAARPPLQPPATVLDLAASPGSDFPLAKSATLPEVINRGFPVLSENTSTPVVTEPDPANGASTGAPARADLRPENIQDAVIRLAGNSQDGIQTAGAFLARLAGRSDPDVMPYMTIPAPIACGPSIFQVRIGSGEVLSAGDEADFLVAFYQHSYQDHLDFLKEGGVLLYDFDNVEPNLDDKRFVYVGVPITGLTVEALGGTAKDKGKNIFVLGMITKIFNLDAEKLKRIISEKFAGKNESIVNTALMAFQAGYAYPVGKVLTHQYRFEHIPKTDGRAQITMDGNQALAYGLIAAGVRYGAGYPITPWSSVMELLRRELPKYGGIFVQAEDELGAVSLALGFSYSGYLAVTGSAGPGISLKSEAIGWASMAEIPLIVCNIQRGGPSTGLPTNVEQSDLHQAIFGSHGDSPRVVL